VEAKLAFIDRLLSFERRVRRVYRRWAANQSFPADLRSFFGDMAEEETRHLAILERSAGLLNFAAMPLQTATAELTKIEAAIAAAERASENPDLTPEEALGHALALESSELNQIGAAWLSRFQPGFNALTQGGELAFEQHIRRLSDAIGRFTANENLHKQAAKLLSAYARPK
jgi:hypothetical protein